MTGSRISSRCGRRQLDCAHDRPEPARVPDTPMRPPAPVALAAFGETARPRVLHVYRRFHPDYTGDGIYYTKLIPFIAEHGVRNEILVLDTVAENDLPTARVDGIEVHYLARAGRPATLGTLLGWLRRHGRDYDILHAHSHTDRWFLAYILARARGIRVMFSCSLNDSPTQLLASYKPRHRAVAALLSRAIDRYVVISPHLLRLALQSTTERRVRFIPQGVLLDQPPPSPEARADARLAQRIGADDFLLLFVGSISRRKNVLFLVEALARIADRRVRLLIVGPALEPDYQAEIDAYVARHALGDRVLFSGFTDDPARFYAAADLFVFASHAEGFPNVYLEAMAHSLPILTLFLPGLVDFIIDHGRTGWLAANATQFVDAIEAARADPAACRRMGAENRRFAERNFDMRLVAKSYVGVYHGLGARGRIAEPPTRAGSELAVRFTRELAAGPASLDLRPIETPSNWRPMLQVVIDTEAEYDWDKGVADDGGRVEAASELQRGFELFARHGVLPTLVVDYPIVTQEPGARVIRGLEAAGCEVGVHLHAWSAPPLVEPRDDWHSFSGNIGHKLELAKLVALRDTVCDLLGRRPRIFKAGRYGMGANTLAAIRALGFDIDLSICPYFDFSAIGGPDFSMFDTRPGWYGPARDILSLPTTSGPRGLLRRWPAPVFRLVKSRWARALRLDHNAARARLLYPHRLSPEGSSLDEMKQLTRLLHRDGLRVFTMSLHSPSLQGGNTPYTRTDQDVRAFVDKIDRYLAFFRDELGGEFSAPSALHARLSAVAPGMGRPSTG